MYTAEEQAEHRKQWADALRSGKYQCQQGQLRLRVGDSFDYLGVVCDISGLGKWVPMCNTRTNANCTEESQAYAVGGVYHTHMLPEEVMDWIGAKYADVHMYHEETLVIPVESNFAEIADVIEAGGVVLQ